MAKEKEPEKKPQGVVKTRVLGPPPKEFVDNYNKQVRKDEAKLPQRGGFRPSGMRPGERRRRYKREEN